VKIEVDQSIKIEQTSHSTVIGISNSKQCAVVISSQIKRKLKNDFRRIGRRRSFAYRTFIAGVILAIQQAKLTHLSDIIIDIEYVGQERRLKSIFFEMWGRNHTGTPDVSFKLIGKRSRAHEVCYRTMRGERKPDAKLPYSVIKKLALLRP